MPQSDMYLFRKLFTTAPANETVQVSMTRAKITQVGFTQKVYPVFHCAYVCVFGSLIEFSMCGAVCIVKIKVQERCNKQLAKK